MFYIVDNEKYPEYVYEIKVFSSRNARKASLLLYKFNEENGKYEITDILEKGTELLDRSVTINLENKRAFVSLFTFSLKEILFHFNEDGSLKSKTLYSGLSEDAFFGKSDAFYIEDGIRDDDTAKLLYTVKGGESESV